ncbi:hypothetical protein Acsp04_52780 [Actinomadura sp. NBRC 104425]|nr:hypothetical protein Acsp04_52780 [Actinomadura sp. NBRC 104425]
MQGRRSGAEGGRLCDSIPPEQSRGGARRAAGPVRTVAVPGDRNDLVLLDGSELVAAVVELAENAS